jgi:aldehyde dehydrogenase (NAD+)
MQNISHHYINGGFVPSHGKEAFALINPSNQQILGKVILGDREDARAAVCAAKAAFPGWRRTTVNERIVWLEKLAMSVESHKEAMIEKMIEEYGATRQVANFSICLATSGFRTMQEVLKGFDFSRSVGSSKVVMEPLGVAAMITPWNASTSFICNKLATALASGCTAVVKPSEMSAGQTQILLEVLHEAELPAGVYNVVNGLGSVVGDEFTINPDVNKISFTGSTAVGKGIARGAAETMKRLTLELGGKSANIILDDLDEKGLEQACQRALLACYGNNGQACIAGSRLLVPKAKFETIKEYLKEAVAQIKVGLPSEETTSIGPLVSKTQWQRVQTYIKLGLEEGARLLAGGPEHPEGFEMGNFVKPTIFTEVTNNMRIAKEEIFGPVLAVITYESEDEAIEIANDTEYGLQAYVSAGDPDRADKVASQLVAGRVLINSLHHDPLAPFGGFKQSGIGREYGVFGLEEYLEPKTIICAH